MFQLPERSKRMKEDCECDVCYERRRDPTTTTDSQRRYSGCLDKRRNWTESRIAYEKRNLRLANVQSDSESELSESALDSYIRSQIEWDAEHPSDSDSD